MTEVKTKRQEALEIYKQHRPADLTHPDDQRVDTPELNRGFALFGEWQELADAAAKDDRLAEHLVNLEKTMFFVDAGFHDPDYLAEVLGWLRSDCGAARRTNHPEAVHEIELRIDEIRILLPEERRKLYF